MLPVCERAQGEAKFGDDPGGERTGVTNDEVPDGGFFCSTPVRLDE